MDEQSRQKNGWMESREKKEKKNIEGKIEKRLHSLKWSINDNILFNA